MHKLLAIFASALLLGSAQAYPQATKCSYRLKSGATLTIGLTGDNSARVKVTPEGASANPADEFFYTEPQQTVSSPKITYTFDPATETLTFFDAQGRELLREQPGGRLIEPSAEGWKAAQTFATGAGDYQYGTGQFQDGYLNINGLTRRLTQVNTQISVPMVISNKGYGILWNNCGLTEFNPADNVVTLTDAADLGETVKVNTTGTTGNKQEERSFGSFTGEIIVSESGEYALLLDVGQSMARKHYLVVDGKVLTEANNLWLPPTTSVKTYLEKGRHTIEVRGEKNDHPSVAWRKVDGSTTFASPVSQGIDYTVFAGNADEVVGQMRALTGQVPLLPKWALGYVHCRERFVSQDDILQNANEFRRLGIPVDVVVQDWQWWGKHGWNAMLFDEDYYPDPKALTDSLHAMDMRLMLSVWAKVDKNSALGKQLEADGRYIPGTDWIDFFNADAAEAYWDAYKHNLLPTGIDSWWQDATEPENDDLADRLVDAGTRSGNALRNVFPLAVNDRVYRGLREERADQRPLILTRSAAPGLQRYGAYTWSGDVGNDWQTLARQISGGLGQMATGLPWWTYDAGGFFRPGNQHSDPDYQQRMLRWIQTAVYLPMMRVHGYMSQTEPWRYSAETCADFTKAIRKRYELLPYIYSEARRVSTEGSTLMRPLVFDFPADEQALKQTTQYMFGKNLLVCPVTAPDVAEMAIYLPENAAGWYDVATGEHYAGGQTTIVAVAADAVPVMVRGGSIHPSASSEGVGSTADIDKQSTLTLTVYPGADATFALYDDDGATNAYRQGSYSLVPLSWDDASRTLTIGAAEGDASRIKTDITVALPDGKSQRVSYSGKETKINL